MPIKCDFCAHRHCTWRYRVVPFQPDDPRYPPPDEVEEWAACGVCYELIRAENYEALAVRTVATISNPAVILTEALRQELIQGFLYYYEEFAAHRLGPAVHSDGSPDGFDDLLEREGVGLQRAHRPSVRTKNGGPARRPNP
jgi:hypothetical protein